MAERRSNTLIVIRERLKSNCIIERISSSGGRIVHLLR